MIYIDFETRATADLKKVGTFEYAKHPATEMLCLAYTFDDDPRVWLWHPAFTDQTPLVGKTKAERARPGRDIPRSPDPVNLFERIAAGDEVEAHNVFFERCIWHFLCVQGMGWPKIRFPQWRCSAAKAASYALPRKLEQLTGNQGLRLVEQKDMVGHRVMQKLTRPRKPTKADPDSPWHQTRADLLTVFRYCVQDVRAERAASKRLRELPPEELRTWQLDQTINAKGIYLDRDLAEAALATADDYRAQAGERLAVLTGGKVKKTTQRVALIEWLETQGVHTDSLAKDVTTQLLKDLPEGPAREAIHLYAQAGKTSVKKYAAMLDRVSDDGRIRDGLMYHGASTGRWAGKGAQPHNLPRNCPKDIDALCEAIKRGESLEPWGEPMEALSRALRGSFIAAPGKEFVSADFSAIEARGTFWIADHEKGLETFRKIDAGEFPNQDIYTWTASEILGRLITKDDDEERQVWGKVPTLACGYQGGVNAIWNFAPDMDEDVAERVVQLYREKHYPVKDFWYAAEKAAIQAVKFPGKVVEQGRWLKWRVHGKFLFCRLPSGRCLSYYQPRLKMVKVKPRPTKKNPCPEPFEKLGLRFWGEWKPKRWGWCGTYGGKLTENIVQALCRDIMRDSMHRCEAAGYPTVLTVHDEQVAEVPAGFGDLDEYCQLMAQTPEWAPGFPVAAEGWRGTRYRK